MKRKAISLLLLILIRFTSSVFADEGMWLPLLLSKYNQTEMQRLGLKLSADQIYSVNQSCLKDAIVSLDHGGCTGSLISGKGLVITNHHCGFDDIASQSSVEKDYLTEGFWAMRPEEELPIPGKTVSFLVRMDDVTEIILKGIYDGMKESERKGLIEKAIDSLTGAQPEGSGLEYAIESMFEGNQFFLFVYETYKDVRMVGAPPSGIGKFGGDTDNWMWPRHTGDFCLLRVYSDADGKPSEYSQTNIPYCGRHFLPVSLAGVQEGDFSMIMGYPGATDRYLTSYGIRHKLDFLNPADILLKTTKMGIMKKYMDQRDDLRIAYAGDYAYLANFQKKSIQESKALKRLNVFDDKKAEEIDFQNWLGADATKAEKFGTVISDFEDIYRIKKEDKADIAMLYLEETLLGAKILYWAYQLNELVSSLEDGDDLEEQKKYFRKKADEFYRSFDPSVDKEIMVAMFSLYRQNLPDIYHPELFAKIEKKYKGEMQQYADNLYSKSIFASKERFLEFLNSPKLKVIMKDPAFEASSSFFASYILTRVTQLGYEDSFGKARREYIQGLKEMNPDKHFYPDANSTMRLTYGTVKPYKPGDAVWYDYKTTSRGVLEKNDPDNAEFKAPGKLLEILKKKDFGRYGENGQLPVCFLTTHDITGGNSGSPVINASGELIGVAFDGNSDAMSSDIKYDTDLQRTISVDIRYVLFVVDKYAGAGYLLDEMKLVLP